MGDFRADINLKMTMFGKTYKQSMWINYWDNGDGIDQRIVDWFAESWRDAQAKHDRIIEKATRASREQATKEFEKAEYKRLKAKFEPPKPSPLLDGESQ